MPVLKLFFSLKFSYFVLFCGNIVATNQKFVSNVAEWINHFIDGKCAQHNLCSKPTFIILVKHNLQRFLF